LRPTEQSVHHLQFPQYSHGPAHRVRYDGNGKRAGKVVNLTRQNYLGWNYHLVPVCEKFHHVHHGVGSCKLSGAACCEVGKEGLNRCSDVRGVTFNELVGTGDVFGINQFQHFTSGRPYFVGQLRQFASLARNSNNVSQHLITHAASADATPNGDQVVTVLPPHLGRYCWPAQAEVAR